jgi:hypothetical protein
MKNNKILLYQCNLNFTINLRFSLKHILKIDEMGSKELSVKGEKSNGSQLNMYRK